MEEPQAAGTDASNSGAQQKTVTIERAYQSLRREDINHRLHRFRLEEGQIGTAVGYGTFGALYA